MILPTPQNIKIEAISLEIWALYGMALTGFIVLAIARKILQNRKGGKK